MKAFTLSHANILQIIEGLLTAQDPARRSLVTDQMRDVVWSLEMTLGEVGVGGDDETLSAVGQRVEEFFNMVPGSLDGLSSSNALQNCAEKVQLHIENSFLTLNFRPASHGDDTALCAHSTDSLYQAAAAAASLLHGRRRLVSMISPHSLIGFVIGVLTPALMDIETIDARRLSPDLLQKALAFGDVIVATPSLWAYLIRESITAPDNTMGVSFGEPMSVQLASDMRRNGIGVLRELYGSTQSGLVAWRDTPSDDFVLFEHLHRGSGPESLETQIVRHCSNGDNIAVPSMDRLSWKTDRTFTLGGRIDGAMQIGSVNIFPDNIAATLKQHEAVEDCNVRISATELGTKRLIADVILLSRKLPDETVAREVDNWARTHLAIHERPHIINLYVSENVEFRKPNETVN